MQGRSGAVYGNGVLCATVILQAIFKGRHLRALGEEVGLEHTHDGGNVGFRDGLATVGDHVESFVYRDYGFQVALWNYSELNLNQYSVGLALP